MEHNNATAVLWRRLKYQLSPQLDIYRHISERIVGLDILEVGFGTGFGTVQLSSTAKHVTATEIDPSAVSFAREVFPLQNILWHIGDITEKVLFPNRKTFDAVVCLEVLEHIPDWETALANLRDCTGDGVLYISGPNANARLRKNDIHEREWTAREFKDNLSRYFTQVSLFDYTLIEEQGDDTGLSPLIAICRNDQKNSI